MGLCRCSRCGKHFADELAFGSSECCYHSGEHVRVNAWPKNGALGNPEEIGWSCCFTREKLAQGCCRGPHLLDTRLEAALAHFSAARPFPHAFVDAAQVAPADEDEAAPEDAPSAVMPELPPPFFLHAVGPLDNLVGISLRYGTTVDALCRLNRLPSPSAFAAHKTLKVPNTGFVAPAVATNAAAEALAAKTAALRSLRSAARLKLGEALCTEEALLYLDGGSDWEAAYAAFAGDVAWERAEGAARGRLLHRVAAKSSSAADVGGGRRRGGGESRVPSTVRADAGGGGLAGLRTPLLP